MIEDSQEPTDKDYFKVNNIKNIEPNKIFIDSTKNNEPSIKDHATRHFGTSLNTIKITKNFVIGEDLKMLNDLCDCYYKQLVLKDDHIVAANLLVTQYKEKIKNKAESLFQIKMEHDDDANRYNIKSNYLNGRMPYFATNIHTDILTDLENNKQYSWSGHISNLLYINDNYEGGELYFPYHNFKLKPEAGMLVSFPGNWYNRHAIMPASDFRYAINIFVKISGFPDHLEYM